MARLRYLMQGGSITDNPLTIAATVYNSPMLANFPTLTNGVDVYAVTIYDPTGAISVPEVVWITAHAAASTTATIVRGREGTAARAHNAGESWVHGPTALDDTQQLATAPVGYFPGQRYYDTTLLAEGVYNGAAWVIQQAQTFASFAAPPASPVTGSTYYDTVLKAIGVYDSVLAAWVYMGSMQTGDIKMGSSATPSPGCLLCDGTSTYTQLAYPALYAFLAAQGFPFGGSSAGGTPSTNVFSVPDLTSAFPFGYQAGVTPIGSTGGAASVTLSAAQMAAHTHIITNGTHTHATPATTSGPESATHGHTMSSTNLVQNTGTGAFLATSGFAISTGTVTAVANTVGHTHSVPIVTTGAPSVYTTTAANNTPSGSAVNILNPYVTVAFYIKF